MKIMCSYCGACEELKYPDVQPALDAGWNSFGHALYCPNCASTWHDRNPHDRPLSGKENTIKAIDSFYRRNYSGSRR